MAKKLKLKKKNKLILKTKPKKVAEEIVEEVQEEEEIHEPKFHSLDEVIDKTRDFSMFFSGVESKQYFNLTLGNGVRNFLVSYHHINRKSDKELNNYKKTGMKMFIDSGVYTYNTNPEYHSYTVEQWEKQLKSYMNWCRKHKDMIFAIANLDLDELVGTEQVDKWNKEYFEPFMLETGIPVCFIWHPSRGEDGWERYCKRYPYVGFSCAGANGTDFTVEYGRRMIGVAEKHGAVVHGMGMTRTGMLPKLPFYTVDSISWKAGLMYGLYSVFTENKVRHLKKDVFQTEIVPILRNYDKKFDIEKLYNYDVEEIIAISVYAFLKSEQYIISQLQNKMYWKRTKLVKQSVDNLEFPTCDQVLDASNETLAQWCTQYNVNPEQPDLVIDLLAILNWNSEDYTPIREAYEDEDRLSHLHDLWINKVVGSDEEKLSDLVNFYTECIEGRDETLLHYGTTFMRRAQERDSYITENTHETVDVSRSDLLFELSNSGMLPAPTDGAVAPEIDELDEEIFSNLGVVPVRDEKGRFLKGQRQVRKPKKIYSKVYPKMFCDTCYSAQTCPEYKQGMVCAFKKMFNRFDTRNQEDVIDAMSSMVEMNLDRLQRASIFEILDGGMLSGDVTNLISQNMQLLKMMQQMNDNAPKDIITQRKVVKSDGTTETVTQVNNAGAGNSILASLFSDLSNASDDIDDTKDIMGEKEELDKEAKKNAIEVEVNVVDEE